MSRLARGRPNPAREARFSCANGDREMFIFVVQPTTSTIRNLTRLIHTLLRVMTIHTYIHTYILHFISGFGKREAHINWPMVKTEKGDRYWNCLEEYWPYAAGLSAVNAVDGIYGHHW